jgi:hypothetical protein
VDIILPGKLRGQNWHALEEASRVASSSDGDAEVDAGHPPRKAQIPSQEKVKQEMAMKARQPLLLAAPHD